MRDREINSFSDSSQIVPQTIIDIYSNDKSKIRLRDKIIDFGSYSNILIDRDGSLIYAMNSDKIKGWKYYDLD